jgi:2-C-methyl-D-erythritol 4-phosphate cytidylyltransferase
VTEAVIERTALAAAEKRAAAPAVKSADTIKLVDDKGMVTSTVDRDKAVLIQTPQIFSSDFIKAALTRAAEKDMVLTDDCAAAEAIGMNVFTVEGDAENIKLTTPLDMLVAEKILADRGEKR